MMGAYISILLRVQFLARLPMAQRCGNLVPTARFSARPANAGCRLPELCQSTPVNQRHMIYSDPLVVVPQQVGGLPLSRLGCFLEIGNGLVPALVALSLLEDPLAESQVRLSHTIL